MRGRIIGRAESAGQSLFVPARCGPIGWAPLPYPPFVIVVVGNPMLRASELGGDPSGPAALAAVAAARAGAEVQLVGKTGDDPPGDALLLALGRAGVGHVAMLRDAAHPTPVVTRRQDDHDSPGTLDPDDDVASIEPADAAARPALDGADVQLALRYLPDYRVVVVAEPQPDDIVAVIADAAAYAGATLLIVVARGWRGNVPPGSLVVETDGDPESRLGELLGTAAVRVDAGMPADQALHEVIGQHA